MLSITVNTLVDERDGDISPGNDVSLRDAIELAPAGETIDFATSLNGGIITLLSGGAFGQISFGKNLTIDASMLSLGITIDGDDPTPLNENLEDWGDGIRIFNINDTSQPAGTSPPLVTMKGLTLTGADSGTDGGAIKSAGRLVLQNMVIDGNEADSGAGVFVAVAGGGSGQREVLRIENSQIENNSATGSGGGVMVRFNGVNNGHDTVQITGSSLSNNMAGGAGGGLFITDNNYATNTLHAVIASSTQFEGNDASEGGAISIRHNFNLRMDLSIKEVSSITGNDATTGPGGGIHAVVTRESELRVENSTISGNTSPSSGGGVYAQLARSSSLAISDSEVSGNMADGDGGGVFARSASDYAQHFPDPRAITISRSLISGNTALVRGGGLYTKNFYGTETLVEDSRITGNDVPVGSDFYGEKRNGGGIYAYVSGTNLYPSLKPRFTITRSTVDDNETDEKGGGIFVCGKFVGEFVATNTTISGNRTLDQTDGSGGGIFIAHPSGAGESVDAHLRNVTVTQNSSVGGGGIGTADLDNVRVRIANSIISENFDLPETDPNRVPNNLVGRLDIANTKYNLVGTGSTILDLNGNSAALDSTNITGSTADSPLLGALADNGGPTPTHALLFGSPAIDQGSDFWATVPLTGSNPEDPSDDDPLTTDQRGTGFARIYDFPGVANGGAGSVDIGAYELTQLCVSTTTDEFDTDLSYGDLSLREAVNHANTAGAPTTVDLKAGVYNLTLSGLGGISQGDLEITGNVTIVGDGPGLTIIDASGLLPTRDRIFDVAGGGALDLSLVTLTGGKTTTFSGKNGGAIQVQNGGDLVLDHSALVGNLTINGGDGGAIYFAATATGTITNSVITSDEADGATGGVYLAYASGTGGAVAVANTIIVNNTDGDGNPDVFAGTNRTFTSGGNNRLGGVASGFTNGVNGDYVGTADYVVTGLADTYDGSADQVVMSVRDAIDLANTTSGAQEIWLPAWDFVLTRERTAAAGSPELDVSQGDLEIKQSLTIRGIGTATSVEWSPGVIDRVLELMGDYNGDGAVGAADFTVWNDTQGSTPDPGAVTADGDDDGDIDDDDKDIYTANFGNTFALFNVSVPA